MEHKDESQMQISVMVPPTEIEDVLQEFRAEGIEAIPTTREGFDGTTAAELLVTLSPLFVGALVKVYTKRLEANRHISYKSKGVEIKGVSEATLLKILERSRGSKADNDSGNPSR